MVHWEEQWAEALSLFFLFIGFIVAVLLQSAFLSYLSVLLAGFMAGRILYSKRHHQPILPFVLMIVGFLVGYLVGNFWASRFWTLVFFCFGYVVSYYLHEKKILVIFKSESFVR